MSVTRQKPKQRFRTRTIEDTDGVLVEVVEKQCPSCRRWHVVDRAGMLVDDHFRLLTSGYFQGRCRACEKIYERKRWHTRSAASKGSSGGAALKRRVAAGSN